MKTELTYRPSLQVSKLRLLHGLLSEHINTKILSYEEECIAKETLGVLIKELGKASLQLGTAYKPVTESERKIAKPISTGLELFSGEELSKASRELSDKEKLAAMTPEQEAQFWEDQMKGIVVSVVESVYDAGE